MRKLYWKLQSYGVDLWDWPHVATWLAGLALIVCLAGCTSLSGGKAKTDAGVDTTVIIRPDGSRIEHTIQHDKRDTDQGRADGMIKDVTLESSGGPAGTLGGFEATLKAVTGGDWLLGGLLIVGGILVAWKLKKLWYGGALVFIGVIVAAYPLSKIAVGIGVIALIGIGIYLILGNFADIVAGVEEFKETLNPEGQEILGDKLGKNQGGDTEAIVEAVKTK
jgi:hypothetical protein